MAVGTAGKCAKVLLILFNLLFWAGGLTLLIFGVWMLVDPQRNYLLDLVQLQDGDPLLLVSAYLFIISGCVSIIIGFLGCCGTIKEIKCMLVSFIIFLVFLLLLELASAVLAITFRNKQECCGSADASDWDSSLWQSRRDLSSGMIVPQTCCKQAIGASPSHPLPSSLARCQLPDDDGQYRHIQHKCCGSSGPTDYDKSWWQINESLGTISYVPKSCCYQSNDARPWNIIPVNDRCIYYPYYTKTANDTVWEQGCHAKLLDWFSVHTVLFVAFGVSIALFQLVGIILSLCLCRKVGYEVGR